MRTNYQRAFRNPTFTRADGGVMPNENGWQTRHVQAVLTPYRPAERSIVGLVESWAKYADAHAEQYDSKIGDDTVLGPVWARIGDNIRQLLDGETGRLDCGTVSSFIADTLTAEGFNPDLL